MYRSALTNNSLPWAEMLNFSSCSHQGSSAERRNGNSENFPSQTIATDFSLQGSPWQTETSGIIPSIIPSGQSPSLPTAYNRPVPLTSLQGWTLYASIDFSIFLLKVAELKVWKMPPSFPAMN